MCSTHLLCTKSIFRFIYLKYASFASQYSRLNSHAVHDTSGVYKIKLWLPIQIHYILPKSYLLGASVEIKRKDTSFPPKNRIVFFCAFQMRATFMKQLQCAALYPSPLGIRCQSTNVLCHDSVVLWKSIIQIYCQLCFTLLRRLQSLHIYVAPLSKCESYDENDLWVPEKKDKQSRMEQLKLYFAPEVSARFHSLFCEKS